MAQQIKMLATQPNDLSSSPRLHMIEGTIYPVSYPLTSTCMPWHKCHMEIHIQALK